MQLIFFFICCWAICSLFKRSPRKRRRIATAQQPRQRQTVPVYSPPPVTMYDCKKAERDRKQAAKKAQAQRDIETAQATINDLDVLMDAAQRRYDEASKDKDTEKALRQIMALRKQIAATESKIEKAKYIVMYE